MRPDVLMRQLAFAERQFTEGAAVIKRQILLIELILKQGLDTARSRELLQSFQDEQILRLAQCDRLQRLVRALPRLA